MGSRTRSGAGLPNGSPSRGRSRTGGRAWPHPRGQDIFRRRKRIELVNTTLKNRGLGRLSPRGLAKAKIQGLPQVIAHNIMLANHPRTKAA